VTPHFVAVAIKCILGIGIAFVVYGLLQKSLRDLLDHVVVLPEATTFYVRAFILVLLFAAIGAGVTDVSQKPGSSFMEYFLEVSSEMSGVVQSLLLTLLGYVSLITLIVVVLRPRNGK
jgi:hypothetical protein